MNRIDLLKRKVQGLYEARNPHRADWADWLYENHIFVLAEYARELSEQHKAQSDLVTAAAMLHDIADSEMSRFSSRHSEHTWTIAKNLLSTTHFSGQEIGIIEDAIRHHSCRGGQAPAFLEGRVMATADAVAHLLTDFYDHALEVKRKEGIAWEDIVSWALPKIERDFNDKIFFDEAREEVRWGYERAKVLFSK